jgi:hypothetical protein
MILRLPLIAVVCLILSFCFSVPALGQTNITSSVSWTPQKVRVVTPNAQFSLRLADLSSSTDYIVGFRAEDVKEATLAVGQVRFNRLRSVRLISEILNWPTNQITVRPGSAEISGLSRAQGSILIFVSVPRGTRLSLTGPSENLASASQASSLLIRNGVIIPEEVKDPRTLLLLLGRPNQPTAGKTVELFQISGGRYVATPKGLASHLVSFIKPSFPETARSLGGDDRQVWLRVWIDQSGSVQRISRVKGNELLLEPAEEAVRLWKFRPFTKDGETVPVEATLLFLFGDDGTVSSPVFTELGR